MKTTGIVRNVDSMGRIVIPMEIRKKFKIEGREDSVEIYVEDDMIILKKYRPACFLCDEVKKTVAYNGYNICEECISKLNVLKEEAN